MKALLLLQSLLPLSQKRPSVLKNSLVCPFLTPVRVMRVPFLAILNLIQDHRVVWRRLFQQLGRF